MSTQPDFDFNETDREMEDIDLYDHERKDIERVYKSLVENIGTRRTLASFEQEAIERFGEIGFKVRVLFYEAATPDKPTETFALPQISIIGRTEKMEEFDHARQQFEVQTDLLGRRGGDDARHSKSVAVSPGGSGFKRSGSGLFVPGR